MKTISDFKDFKWVEPLTFLKAVLRCKTWYNWQKLVNECKDYDLCIKMFIEALIVMMKKGDNMTAH